MMEADDDEDDFESLMAEVEAEARQAASAYFEDLYEASHGHPSQLLDDDLHEYIGNDENTPPELDAEPQRKGGLKLKLAACPSGDFPVSIYSSYNQGRWILIKGVEYTETAILIENVPSELRSLKRAISYYFLPATNPFGTIKSFVSSMNYAEAFAYVQRFVLEENHLVGVNDFASIISGGMLNQALDNCKANAYPHSYLMLFFYINFWLALSAQCLIPDEFCLDVGIGEVDTLERRKDVYELIAANFVGWKPFSHNELSELLGYAYFWIDHGVPVIKDVVQYLSDHSSVMNGKNYCSTRVDQSLEKALGQQVNGVEIVGFTSSTSVQRQRGSGGRMFEYRRIYYYWRFKYRIAVDRVRNAIFILFSLMTGMRKREMATLTFDDVICGVDGLWRVDFSRYKTSSDPNFLGDADFISIPKYLGEAIQSFKQLREFGGYYLKGYIFQSTSGNMSVSKTDRMMERVARAVGRETGVVHLHIHRFRKTIAELLINESEANIDIIRMIFGHSSYVMTLRYIARNPFLVASVVETLKEHFAEDFVDVVRAIHTGVYAGEAAHRVAEQVGKRPELFSGTVLKTTVMQYVTHLFEGGSSLRIQRTSIGTMCLSHIYHDQSELPPCLASAPDLIFPVRPDFSNCQIHCENNLILENSKGAIEHNLKFYRTILLNATNLKPGAIKELESKISVNERLLEELLTSAAKKMNLKMFE
ncbi:site-specific integrase [Pseudomonas urmiensis]|uniref:Site-specific integrase n=2 Tax=Pseudomonas TaxID=286 RepID=A0ABW8NQL8_9PSED|nr:site-specific integrase [Pseudomonas fluorescens]